MVAFSNKIRKYLLPILMVIVLVSCKPLTLTGVSKGIHADLKYKISPNGSLENSIFIPENLNGGAVLILPSCGGIQRWNVSDIKKNWLNPMLKLGFVVGVVDYNANRGAKRPWNCGKNKHLSHHRLVRDVYNGVQVLAAVPGIDKNKIFTFGTSLGAQIGAAAISREYTNIALKEKLITPRAHVGLYGGCSYPSQTYLTSDVTSPVLWLSGGRDVEVGDECNQYLYNRIKKVEPESKFVLYRNATHCWDCSQLNGYTKNTYYGVQTYIFDPDITSKSQIETFQFLQKFFK